MILSKIWIPAIILLSLSSCGRHCQREDQQINNKTNTADTVVQYNQQSPTTIQMNKSIVLAEVLDIQAEEGDSYLLLVNVLEVSEDPAYPSFASKDIVYTLRPAYGVDEEGKLLKNEINEGLLGIKKVKAGEKIKGIISQHPI